MGANVRYIFDFHGTLQGNRAASDIQTQALVDGLLQAGHEVVVWSGDVGGIPAVWRSFLETRKIVVLAKPAYMRNRELLAGSVAVDDDAMILRLIPRLGATPVAAADILSLASRPQENPPADLFGLKLELCSLAELDHHEAKRQYAHACHQEGVICICKAFFELPDTHKYGILLHEFGHVLDPDEEDEHVVDGIATKHFGVTVQRRSSRYGEDLEWISPRDVRRAARIVARELRLFD